MSAFLDSFAKSADALTDCARRNAAAAFPVVFLAFIGGSWFAYQLLVLVRVLAESYILPGIPLSNFGAKKKAPGTGAWAVVTGATDGIGREFALQLASAGFNIFLASRSAEKLGKVAAEIEIANPGIKTKTEAIDFSSGDDKQYDALEAALAGLTVGVLVNNVGKSHNMPVTFDETDPEEIRQIIEINVTATMRVTKMLTPRMIQQKRGLIINMGSFAGQAPTPLLAAYSGSKAFLIGWSQALGEELRHHKITVSLLNTYFVVSNMSKIRRSSAMVPTPKQYVRQALKTIGSNCGAVGRPFSSTPWPMHALVDWAIEHLIPSKALILSYTYDQQQATRKRALRKLAKAQ
ncbi:hypothetical protein OC834_001901 [Tilletia horrida]|uniref:Very-long-chain 3-oxoacyl-CoA reductase n=1 Tax=Tilletia horrida TaxID=155126 RepID=A0AAN6GC03_9BASI|nr:hypothetical protein OC835_005556 [Tilletia horrida]KAK0529293.1 hypothetical protein OC842_004281 [Tilletia horrida]KAK0534431.1 hypothetical protein OC834_001901 [Tilletia horrida]KAK0564937.1 hypothetical protein OC844_001460 [Tilletia horrida]